MKNNLLNIIWTSFSLCTIFRKHYNLLVLPLCPFFRVASCDRFLGAKEDEPFAAWGGVILQNKTKKKELQNQYRKAESD